MDIGLSALTAAAVTVRKVLAERRKWAWGRGSNGRLLNEILLASGSPREGGLLVLVERIWELWFRRGYSGMRMLGEEVDPRTVYSLLGREARASR